MTHAVILGTIGATREEMCNAMHTVGPKGQVVVEKEIRDRLGIAPGWRALQSLVGDHVETRFFPPEHA